MEIVYREIEYFFFFFIEFVPVCKRCFRPPPSSLFSENWLEMNKTSESFARYPRHIYSSSHPRANLCISTIPLPNNSSLAKPIEFSNPTWIWGATETTREIGFHCCKSVPPPPRLFEFNSRLFLPHRIRFTFFSMRLFKNFQTTGKKLGCSICLNDINNNIRRDKPQQGSKVERNNTVFLFGAPNSFAI